MSPHFWELGHGLVQTEEAQGVLRHGIDAPQRWLMLRDPGTMQCLPLSTGETNQLSSFLSEEKKVKRECHKSQSPKGSFGAEAIAPHYNSCCRRKCFSAGTRAKLFLADTKALRHISEIRDLNPLPQSDKQRSTELICPGRGGKGADTEGQTCCSRGESIFN